MSLLKGASLLLVLAGLGSSLTLQASDADDWISRKTLESCIEVARSQGIKWNYVAYVENDKAHLLWKPGRGQEVFLCNPMGDGRHAEPAW